MNDSEPDGDHDDPRQLTRSTLRDLRTPPDPGDRPRPGSRGAVAPSGGRTHVDVRAVQPRAPPLDRGQARPRLVVNGSSARAAPADGRQVGPRQERVDDLASAHRAAELA